MVSCQQIYTHKTYAKTDTEQLYAMICHNGKKVITIPAEEWPAHKAHGDYRGPCRARGIAGASRQVSSKQRTDAFIGRKEQLKASRQAYERNQERIQFQQDSLISAAKQEQ